MIFSVVSFSFQPIMRGAKQSDVGGIRSTALATRMAVIVL
jgi:hypothetical protein